MCVGECKCVCVIGEMYKIQYIIHIIIIIKCFSIMNIIIMYQNSITVHFQVYMNDFHLQKKKLPSINQFILNVIVFFRNKLVTFGMSCVCV